VQNMHDDDSSNIGSEAGLHGRLQVQLQACSVASHTVQ